CRTRKNWLTLAFVERAPKLSNLGWLRGAAHHRRLYAQPLGSPGGDVENEQDTRQRRAKCQSTQRARSDLAPAACLATLPQSIERRTDRSSSDGSAGRA